MRKFVTVADLNIRAESTAVFSRGLRSPSALLVHAWNCFKKNSICLSDLLQYFPSTRVLSVGIFAGAQLTDSQTCVRYSPYCLLSC